MSGTNIAVVVAPELADTPATPKKKKKHGIPAKYILGAFVLGALFGYVFPSYGVAIKPVGDAFIKMIKMVVVPLIFSTLTVGIASTGDFKKVSRIGGKALIWFTFASTFALVLGLVLANVVKPGTGVELIQLAAPDSAGKAAPAFRSTTDLILAVIPTNIFEALSTANLLQIVFFSCFFGLAITAIGEKAQPVYRFMEGLAEIMFEITGYVMKVSPFGVFAFIAWTVGKYGLALVIPLGKLVLTLYLSVVIFVVLILGTACFFMRLNPFQVLRVIKEPLLIAITTCSSEAALPLLMEKLEKFGIPKHIVSFVLPTGYSFNLDGAALYKCMALMFIAQMYHIPMDLQTQLSMILFMVIVQKGSAGVPGMAFIGLSAGVVAFNLPMEGLFMIMGVDRILEMGRTGTNLAGNAIATFIVARWEKELPDDVIQAGYQKDYS